LRVPFTRWFIRVPTLGIPISQRNKIVNLTALELNELDACKTEKEWNATCDKIKAARGGQYPPDWFMKIIASGFINRKIDSFKSSATS
jgi:hypothetical protein